MRVYSTATEVFYVIICLCLCVKQLVERLALLEREHLTLQQTVEVQAADVNVIQHQLIGKFIY